MSAAEKTKKISPEKVTTYKDAGVDIEAGAEFVSLIAPMVKETHDSRVLADIGGFSGLYSLDLARYEQPVLVSSTDGVGSKLKIAFMAGKHDTIGIDLVAMSVNDILAPGARPLFFLDYLAVSKLEPNVCAEILTGIVKGCKEARCALIGGETAELPEFYSSGEYDLAGFVVGVVERDQIIDGSEVGVGDKIIGLGSNGLHSNGYTLARRLIFDSLNMKITDKIFDTTVGEELLRPTLIYVNTIHVLLRDHKIAGIANITGGGLTENIPRILPQTCLAVIQKKAWEPLPIFKFIQQEGGIAEQEMFRTFNMGLGMVVIVPADQAEDILGLLAGMDQEAYLIGEIRERQGQEPSIQII